MEERRKIWNLFFQKFRDEREDFRILPRAKDYVLSDEALSRMEWNGREIRNGIVY